jgi:hypothetical protein
MNTRRNPQWWNDQYESGWERVKAALRRDWDQTKHDFGGKEPDTDQNVDDTVKQAAGKQPIPARGEMTIEEKEDAYRFGFGARAHYGRQYPTWNEAEFQLRQDWHNTYNERDWDRFREPIRRGWEYDEAERLRKAA